MRCGKVKRLLTPYLDARLDDDRRREVDAHLGDCAECTKELRLLKAAHLTLKATEPAHPPEELAQRAADAAFAAGQDEIGPAHPSLLEQLASLRWPAAVTATAAATVALVLMLTVKPVVPKPDLNGNGSGEPVASLTSWQDTGLDDDDMTSAVLGQEVE